MLRAVAIAVIIACAVCAAEQSPKVCKCDSKLERVYVKVVADSLVGYSFVKGKDLLYSVGKTKDVRRKTDWHFAGVTARLDDSGKLVCSSTTLKCVNASAEDLNYEINLMTRRYIRDSLVVLERNSGGGMGWIIDSLVRIDAQLRWEDDWWKFREELIARGKILVGRINDSLVSEQVLQLIESCRDVDDVACSKKFVRFP